MRAWRSLLFVPGNDSERLGKAPTRGADAVIVDLEDGVTPREKALARRDLPGNIAALGAAGADVLVRINANWREAVDDLDAAIRPDLAAIVAPKVEDSARLSVLSQMIGELESRRGLATGSIDLVALIETPAALARLTEIAAVRRVVGLALGSEDFALALGVAPTPQALDLPCRQIALAAAARGQMALAIPFSIAAFRDEEGLSRAALDARAFGATGGLCIHPGQVRTVNAIFQPSDADRREARAIVAAWERAEASGLGVVTIEGQMVDAPVVKRARRILERPPLAPG